MPKHCNCISKAVYQINFNENQVWVGSRTIICVTEDATFEIWGKHVMSNDIYFRKFQF